MIYTDGTHLITDNEIQELHDFAQRLGLDILWFQDHRKAHYDLTSKNMRRKAIQFGAQFRTTKQLLKIIKRKELR